MAESSKKKALTIAAMIGFAFLLYRIDAVILLVQRFLAIITPLIIGMVLALLINLPMRSLERHLKFSNKHPALLRARRAICLNLSVLIVIAVIALLLIVIIPEVIAAAERLIKQVPDLLKQLEAFLIHSNSMMRESLGFSQMDEATVREQFQKAYQYLLSGLNSSSGVVLSAAQSLLNIVVGFVFAVYLLFNKEKISSQLSRFLRATLSQRTYFWVSDVIKRLIQTFSSFIGGQCLQAILSALFTWITMAVFGFPYAVLIGLIVFVTAFIPIFGPYIAGLFGTLLVFTSAPPQAIWFLLLFLIIQQLEGSLIYPRIMSNAINIPSIWVLIASTLGGGIMGISGMLLFIPLTAVIYHLTAEFVARRESTKHEAVSNSDSV